MAKEQLKFSLITPERRVFEGPADFVALPAHDGEFGILFRRAPLVVQLGAGRLKLRLDQVEQMWFVDGGFAQVIDDRVTVLTQQAMRTSDIHRGTALADLDRAREISAFDEENRELRAQIEASARARLRLTS